MILITSVTFYDSKKRFNTSIVISISWMFLIIDCRINMKITSYKFYQIIRENDRALLFKWA